MPIVVQCPNKDCRASYTVAETFSNRNVQCKRCGARFVARPTLDEKKSDTCPSSTGSDTFSTYPAEFGRYRVLKLLGRGGMGSVYLALDSQLGRQVALKLPTISVADSPQRAARFVREARSAAVLHHANICTVYDAGEIDGRPFISMALVEGRPLDEYLDDYKSLPQHQAAEIARKIALALAHAHQKGVVHRDLKPANVILAHGNEPVVTDFGLAKRVSEADPNESKLTKDGSVLGTPAYMAPEQVRGEIKNMGPATDIYALGVILFEMLAGRAPYQGPMGVVMGQIIASPVPSVSEFRADVDPRLEAICRQAMAKDALERFSSMDAFAQELSDYLRSPAATPLTPLPEEADIFGDLERSFPSVSAGPTSPRPGKPLGRGKRTARIPSEYQVPLAIAGSALGIVVLVALILLLTRGKDSNDSATNDSASHVEASSDQVAAPKSTNNQPADAALTNTDSRDSRSADTQSANTSPAQTAATTSNRTSGSGWISLFAGNKLGQWKGGRPGSPGGRVVDDYVEIIPGGGGLISQPSFGPDYELKTEFWVPHEPMQRGQRRGNSGIYLNGRYEIQILDSYQQDIDPLQACGALYNVIGPTRDATRPPGTWQSLHIIFHAPLAGTGGVVARAGELSVTLNDTLVIDRAEFSSTSAGGLGTDLAVRGPILLQDHNSPVRFRNFQVRELGSSIPQESSQSSAPRLVVVSELGGQRRTGSIWVSADGLNLFWENESGQNLRLWTARRDAPGQPFHDAKELFAGDDLTVSGDGLEMIYVGDRAMSNTLHVRTRNSTSDSWGAPRKINELSEFGFIAGPQLAPGGHRMWAEMFEHERHGLTWNVMMTRKNRQSPWSRPKSMAISGLPNRNVVRFPFVVFGGRYMLGCHDSYGSGMVVLRSTDGGNTYSDPVEIEIPGNALKGKFPRYVPETRELFFVSTSDNRSSINHIYILRNFDPAECYSAEAASSSSTRLTNSGSSDFVPMFNGRDLSGWTVLGQPKWSWADGRVLATPGGRGLLMTNDEYANFEIELEFRLGTGAGSGLYLRTAPEEATSGGQMEVQILDDTFPEYAKLPEDGQTGSVYSVFARQAKPPFKQNDWNRLRVRLDGRQIQVWVNDVQTVNADLDSAPGRTQNHLAFTRTMGRIALQQNQKTDVEFRNVRIKRLP